MWILGKKWQRVGEKKKKANNLPETWRLFKTPYY